MQQKLFYSSNMRAVWAKPTIYKHAQRTWISKAQYKKFLR